VQQFYTIAYKTEDICQLCNLPDCNEGEGKEEYVLRRSRKTNNEAAKQQQFLNFT
jgi:hypothetical protein